MRAHCPFQVYNETERYIDDFLNYQSHKQVSKRVSDAHRWSELCMKPTSCLCAIFASSESTVRGRDCTHRSAIPILSGSVWMLCVCCRALPNAAMAFSVACPFVSSLQQSLAVWKRKRPTAENR